MTATPRVSRAVAGKNEVCEHHRAGRGRAHPLRPAGHLRERAGAARPDERHVRGGHTHGDPEQRRHESRAASPEEPFEMLVKQAIKKMSDPCQKCARLVHDELARIARQLISAQDMQRYPSWRNRLRTRRATASPSGLAPAETMIASLVDCQLAHINTSHPEFVGGSLGAEAGAGGGGARRPTERRPRRAGERRRAGRFFRRREEFAGAPPPTPTPPRRTKNRICTRTKTAW